MLRTGNWPLGHTWSGQKRDGKRLPTAWQRASDAGRGLAGLPPSSSRVLGCPGAGFDGHDLASPCRSHQSPAATLGIRPSLLGFPLLDSGDGGRQAVRGSVREGASAPSWPPHLSSLRPVTANQLTEAETANAKDWVRSRRGDVLSGGGWLPQPTSQRVRKGGVNQWVFPYPQVI